MSMESMDATQPRPHAEKERLVYVSPGERKIKQECSELHDVLQHSQTELVREKTRRYRFLERENMSRSEILKHKHQALLNKRRQEEEKSAALGSPFPPPQSSLAAEPVRREVSVEKSTEDGACDSDAPRCYSAPHSPHHEFSLSAPQAVRRSVDGGYSSPSSLASRNGDNRNTTAWQTPRGESHSAQGPKPASAKSDRAPILRQSQTADKKKDEHSVHVVWPHAEEEGNGEKPRPRLTSSLSMTRVDSPPRSGLVGTSPSFRHKSVDKVTLDNFELLGRPIDSPHSLLAMKRFGVMQEDLDPKPMNRDPWQAANSSIHSDLGDKERERVALMRAEFEERSRQRLIEKLQLERERHRKAYAILITDSQNSEGAPPELKAYGAAARASYVAGPSPTGRKAPVRGSLSYADEMAASVVEKGRQKVEKLQLMEHKRMQTLLRSHIVTKDRMDDLQEKLSQKFSNKSRLIDEQRRRLRAEREKKLGLHRERTHALTKGRQEGYAAKMAKLEERHQLAEDLHKAAKDKVRMKMHIKSEMASMKAERHHQRVIMAARAADFQRMQVEEKLQRIQAHAEKVALEREKLAVERARVTKRIQDERTQFGHLVSGFRETGVFRKPRGNVELDSVKDLLMLEAEVPVAGDEDLNPEAELIEQNGTRHGKVKKGGYVYYKIRHANTRNRINIVLKNYGGDPDLFVGNHTCPYPTKNASTWRRTGYGDDKLSIHPFDLGFEQGFLYIGVYGVKDCEYKLAVRWTSDEKQLEGRRRGPQQRSRSESGMGNGGGAGADRKSVV